MNEIIFSCTTAERIVFHFNKASLTDANIPMWVIKHKGASYYVHHVVSAIGFNTKETPLSEHTKGSVQFKGKLTVERKEGVDIATIY